ncbi:MAG: hypothetical protein WCD72_02655 [Dehalococcoidia bacterium]
MRTFDQLVEFLIGYRWTVGDLNCGPIAKDLQDKAKSAGIRAGVTMIRLPTPFDPDHYFNVFDTTDKGRIYIDASRYGRIFIIEKLGNTYEFSELYDNRVLSIFPWEGGLTESLLVEREKNLSIIWS